MSDCKSLQTVSWSNDSLELFRTIHRNLTEQGFTNASVSMLLCMIFQDTYAMHDYFISNNISENDVRAVIQTRYRLNCYTFTTNFKVKPVYKGKKSLQSATSSIKNDFNLQTFIIYDSDNSPISFWVTSEFMDVLLKTVTICKDAQIDCITLDHIMFSMFSSDSHELCEFFEELKLDYGNAKQYYMAHNSITIPLMIPHELSDILSVLNYKIDISKPCEILCREQECDLAWNIMLKRDKHNVLIVGNPGEGKTSLVEKLTFDIEQNNVPQQFSHFKMLSVDIYALLNKISISPNCCNMLIDFIQSKSDVIVFIDNINDLILFQESQNYNLLCILEPLWKSNNVTIIATINSTEYIEHFSKYDIYIHFDFVKLTPVHIKDMYSMLKLKIESLCQYHGIAISYQMAQFAIKIAFCLFGSEQLGFHSILNLIDASLATAKRIGNKVVTRDAILQNCHLTNYMLYDMPGKEYMRIATHEASHYVVLRELERTIHRTCIAIVGVPYSTNLGITFSVVSDLCNLPNNIDYYLGYMAYLLAGKVSEEIFGYEPSNGSCSDLSKATELAFEAIDNLDLLGLHYRNAMYISSKESLLISKILSEQMNKKAEELIHQAILLAEDVINKKQSTILAIADALRKKHVMVDDELERIWQSAEKN